MNYFLRTGCDCSPTLLNPRSGEFQWMTYKINQHSIEHTVSGDSTVAFQAVSQNLGLNADPGFILSKVCLKSKAFSDTCPSVKLVQALYASVKKRLKLLQLGLFKGKATVFSSKLLSLQLMLHKELVMKKKRYFIIYFKRWTLLLLKTCSRVHIMW